MKTIIQKINARPGQRIIATSDIHGHLANLVRLLGKLQYSVDDILVVVGELVDKGPTILDMDSYIFVHGGIPTDDLQSLAGTERHDWLKNDCFLEKGFHFSKCVVTGHWPVSLYRHEEADLRPFFEYERRNISMNGGCGLKEAGQLNALIFPDRDAAMEEIGWEYQDEFPVVTALDGPAGILVYPVF